MKGVSFPVDLVFDTEVIVFVYQKLVVDGRVFPHSEAHLRVDVHDVAFGDEALQWAFSFLVGVD